MTDFGPNGTVMSSPQEPAATRSDYTIHEPKKIKRVALACFLCGVNACISVTIIAIIIIFSVSMFDGLTGNNGNVFGSSRGFLGGSFLALGMSAMNWWLFYITIPAAWIAIGCSIGRFPHRGITRAIPYYRWGMIWGALLVGGTTTFFSTMLGTGGWDGLTRTLEASYVLGAALTGGAIGAAAGALCGALFLAIVRPAEQVRRIEIEVF